MTVAVTGGTGFVGGNIIRALTRQGHHVLDVGRRPSRHGAAEFVRLNLTDGPSRAQRLGDIPIVHCAAEVGDGFDDGMLRRNVVMMDTSLSLGTGPFIHMSSSSVYSLEHPSLHVRPEDATGHYRWFGTYSESKFVNEQQLTAARRDSALIIRPHAVYGPGDNTLLPRVLHATRRGVVPLPRGGRALHELTWVGNIAAAVTRALTADIDGTHAVNVTDGDPVPIGDAFEAAAGRPIHILPIPMRTARHVAVAARGRFGISPYSVRQLGYERTYNLDLARELLDWQPVSGTIERLANLDRHALAA